MDIPEAAAPAPDPAATVHRCDTVIIGSGFAGLLAAIRLKARGLHDFVLLERNPELGGTWQVNTYPGAEVDVPTCLYSVSFAPYPFSKTYAPQSELLAYTRHLIERYALRPHARTGQGVRRLGYDEASARWRVETASGTCYDARFVIDCSGVLANPHIPEIAGAGQFRGALFHAAQWDHRVDCAGQRVAVIGSGCSAAQIVPAIAPEVARLTLFMGKAQWILPRADRHYSRLERWLRGLPGIRHLLRWTVFAFYDVRFIAFRRYPGTATLSRWIKGYYRRRLARELDRHIRDERLRRHMLPDYELGCRRVIPTNTYLPALARPNVEVELSGIDAITPTGIRTRDGREIALDVIVYATGYYAYTDVRRALTFDVHGVGGRHLNREWEAGFVSYKGLTVSGYPNYFKVNGPNTGTGHSSQMSYMEVATDYIVQAIAAVHADPTLRAIDARPELQAAYMATVRAKLSRTVWQTADCTAFYRRNMTAEVTSLSPEPVTGFILSRKWFRLADYRLIR